MREREREREREERKLNGNRPFLFIHYDLGGRAGARLAGREEGRKGGRARIENLCGGVRKKALSSQHSTRLPVLLPPPLRLPKEASLPPPLLLQPRVDVSFVE